MNHRHRQLAAFDHDLRASAHASQQPGEVASGLPFRNMDHIVHHAAIIPVVRQEPHAPAPKTGHRLGHLDLSFGPGLINIGNGSWKNPGLNLRIQAPVIAENSTAAQSFPKSFPLACPAFLFHSFPISSRSSDHRCELALLCRPRIFSSANSWPSTESTKSDRSR